MLSFNLSVLLLFEVSVEIHRALYLNMIIIILAGFYSWIKCWKRIFSCNSSTVAFWSNCTRPGSDSSHTAISHSVTTNAGCSVAIAQGGAIQISNPASDGVQGLQTLTMTNSGAPQPGATIVQYAAQTPEGTQQFFVPGSQVVVQVRL
uniref:Uncharacterized protein n=1 Tax=Gopherus agassizii TaxID=38772 RepID=A0A452GHH2_9SAUR